MVIRNRTLFLVAILFTIFSLALWGVDDKRLKVLEYGVLDYSADGDDLLEKFAPDTQSYLVSADKPGRVTAVKGTRFDIPKDAFVFRNGSKVTGQVEFSVVEVIDDLDFVTAGIDLSTIDENGQEVYFQSAGMFHVGASQNGRELLLAPGKTIQVQFPDVVPGDQFFVYKMDPNGKWVKHGHNQEIGGTQVAQAAGFDERYGGVGVRVYAIDGMTWWNYDSPFPHVACVKGKVSDPDKVLSSSYMVYTIGVNYKGSFSLSFQEPDFKLNAHREKLAKVMVVDSEGHIGISDVIQITGKRGHFKYQEGEEVQEVAYNGQGGKTKFKNYCQDVGEVVIKDIPKSIMKDKRAFSRYLGLKTEDYAIEYYDEESETGDRFIGQ